MFEFFKNLFSKNKFAEDSGIINAAKEAPIKKGIQQSVLAKATRTGNESIFVIAEHPRGVVPEDYVMANDENILANNQWATNNATLRQDMHFLGYSFLAELSQRPEYRKIVETFSKEMTRKWIKITSVGEQDNTIKIKQIETEMKRLNVQNVFCEAIEQEGFFGRAHIYLDTGDTDNANELKTAINTGSGILSKIKINRDHPLKRLSCVEPIWTYPNSYNSSDPLRPDYFKPTNWFVQGRLLHETRLLTLVSRSVPDLLKPAYSFGGLPLTQMVMPYVDNWLRTRQAVSDLIYKFSTQVLKTNMQDVLQGASGDNLLARAQLYNAYATNHGIMMLDKDSEEFVNVSVPLGTLDALQAQAQEHMSSVSGIPLIKLLGITPKGLNASSDGELEVFYAWIEAQQESLLTTPLQTVLNFIQLSLFGEVDTDIGFTWQPLYTLSRVDIANVRKLEIETDVEAINGGILDPLEARTRVASDEDSPYASLDLGKEIVSPQEQQMQEMQSQQALGGEIPGRVPDNPFAPKNPLEPKPTVIPFAAPKQNPFPKSVGDEFQETLHPRDKIGEFAEKGGGSKTSYGARNEGESDKQYAKRIVDKLPKPNALPDHDLSRYFNKKDGSKTVSIDNLKSIKNDSENQQGGENGPKRMLAAYEGALSKRDPITVMPDAEEGKYTVIDGNGTYTTAKEYGFKELPVTIVSREEGQNIIDKNKSQHESMVKSSVEEKVKGLFDSKTDSLPNNVSQPISEPVKLFSESENAISYLQDFLNKGKGVASQLGYRTMTGGVGDAIENGEFDKQGGLVFIAPLKGMKRSTEKVEQDYQGHWEKLLDTARASIAVDSLDQVKETIGKLEQAGLEIVKKPKNRFANPTAEHYRDALVNFKAPNGIIGELQLHVKPMLVAKAKGHVYYEQIRSLNGQYGDHVETWPEDARQQLEQATSASRKLYDDAWSKAIGQ